MVAEGARPSVANEQFVEVWQKAETAEEVAKALKVSKAFIFQKKAYLVGLGVKLKKMPRKNSRAVDVEALNELAQKSYEEKYGEGASYIVDEVAKKHGINKEDVDVEGLMKLVLNSVDEKEKKKEKKKK